MPPRPSPRVNEPRDAHIARAPNPMLIAHLAGDQATMGAQHGAMVRAAGGWRDAVEFYPRMPERLVAGASPIVRAAIRPAVGWMLNRLERHRDPELRARTQAFLRAVGVSTRWSRYYHVMDAFQNVVNLAARHRLGPMAHALPDPTPLAMPPACSTLAAWGGASADGALRHARNFDFPGVGVWDRGPTVVFCTPERGLRYAFVTTRGADVCGITAFNEAGLTLTAHTRFHPDVDTAGWPIVDLTHEIVRRAADLESAERVARERPIASTWALCVSSARDGGAMSLETTAAGVVRLDPAPGEDFLAVTNHYCDEALAAGAPTISPGFERNTFGRHAALRSLGRRGGLDAAALKRALGAHHDPAADGRERASGGALAQVLSVQSVVVEPARQRLHLSVGPAPTGAGPWTTVDWSWQATPGFRVESFDGAAGEALETDLDSRYRQGAGARAYGAMVAAAASASRGEAPSVAARLVDEAVAHDPDDATFRLMAGGVSLQRGKAAEALGHFEAALGHEPSPFYHAQLLLWASRAAAAAGDTAAAERHRARLLATDHAHVRALLEDARADVERPPSARRLGRVRLNYHLAELSL